MRNQDSNDQIALAIPLVDAMNLNLVRGRIRSLARGGAFIAPEDLEPILHTLDRMRPSTEDVDLLVRKHLGGKNG